MKLAIYEILELADSKKRKKDKIEILRQNSSDALADVLRFALDPSLKILLPEGPVPPFQSPNPEAGEVTDLELGLLQEHKRLYLFVEGGNPNLKQNRREQLFLQVLSYLHPKDAELLIAAKDRKLPYKTITRALVDEAFPGLIAKTEEKT